jgi:hypothetical protein
MISALTVTATIVSDTHHDVGREPVSRQSRSSPAKGKAGTGLLLLLNFFSAGRFLFER